MNLLGIPYVPSDNLKELPHGLPVRTGRGIILHFTACVLNNAHNLCIPHIPAIACTIVMVFLDCILTSDLNL